MLLTFLGTRANLPTSSPGHRWHSALLIEVRGLRLLIDCGSDWRDRLPGLAPDGVLLSHAHDDHAGGLTSPLPVPVHATAASWRSLPELAKDPQACTCQEGETLQLGHLQATPLPLPHSLRAPTVGWLLASGRQRLFYAPDGAGPPAGGMPQVDLYIGDGSGFSADLLRIEAGILCGHAPITSQLEWCRSAGIREAIFTHCGADILAAAASSAGHLARLAEAFAIKARFAEDGLQVRLGKARRETPADNG